MRLLRLRVQPWHSAHCCVAGACAKLNLTSILTFLRKPVPPHCPHPSQGGFENLTAIRQAGVQCPLLCKEFIVEVRAVGRGRGLLTARDGGWWQDAVWLHRLNIPLAGIKLAGKCGGPGVQPRGPGTPVLSS